jgi:hypothetical protein
MGMEREIEGEAEASLPCSFILLAKMGAASILLTIKNNREKKKKTKSK